VDVTAKATMYHWSLDQMVEEAYLRFKPRYEWSLQAQGQVMDGLKIQAGFEYIDRRQQGDAAVQNLFTGASYDLVHRITVFARVNNLLNKEYRGVNVYPAEKLGFMVGIHWAF
jgi:outer membrane cobalamin receptor